MKKGYLYIQEKRYKLLYKFPKRYADQSDLIIELIPLSYIPFEYIAAPNLKMVKAEEIEVKYPRVENLYDTLNLYWVMRNMHNRGYEFFLLDQDFIFDYFIKNWEKYLRCSSESINEIKENCDYYNKLAIRNRDEEIIREII